MACFLGTNHDLLYVPTYRVKKIYEKNKSNKTNRKNKLNWEWYNLVQELEYRCAKHGSVAVLVSEAYTSKTCSKYTDVAECQVIRNRGLVAVGQPMNQNACADVLSGSIFGLAGQVSVNQESASL